MQALFVNYWRSKVLLKNAYNLNERTIQSPTKRHSDDIEKCSFTTPKKQRPEPTVPIESDAPKTSIPIGKFP